MTELLPRVLVVTDRTLTRGRRLVEVVTAAVQGGAEWVLLREKDLPSEERAELAGAIRSIAPHVIVASDATIDSDGVHLASGDPFPEVRPALVGRSCHSASDLLAAAAEGCDYATLSPIFPSPSKPGYGPPLGMNALESGPLPLFALGGVDSSNAQACLDGGAAGVAVMGYAMGADDPAEAVRRLLG